ncbi:MAG: hypothetical protein V7K67_07635 [Nostoc sp.]|uniref:hypothetical protein n=1 Tax=Nostoc sp. TaxID=1180 RepID=UPI002FF412EC
MDRTNPKDARKRCVNGAEASDSLMLHYRQSKITKYSISLIRSEEIWQTFVSLCV